MTVFNVMYAKFIPFNSTSFYNVKYLHVKVIIYVSGSF